MSFDVYAITRDGPVQIGSFETEREQRDCFRREQQRLLSGSYSEDVRDIAMGPSKPDATATGVAEALAVLGIEQEARAPPLGALEQQAQQYQPSRGPGPANRNQNNKQLAFEFM